jgi:DNA transformation protein and related proteins
MTVSRDYLAYILEQLTALGALRSQRMFGGAGLYCDETFFGIVSEDTLYLRTDEAGRSEFTARGMQPFRPYADRAEVSVTYYEVPAEVLEDASELVTWGRRAVAAAAARAAERRSRPRARAKSGRVKHRKARAR